MASFALHADACTDVREYFDVCMQLYAEHALLSHLFFGEGKDEHTTCVIIRRCQHRLRTSKYSYWLSLGAVGCFEVCEGGGS